MNTTRIERAGLRQYGWAGRVAGCVFLAGTALAGVPATSAEAQVQDPDAEALPSRVVGVQLEEIIVTSRKRDERLDSVAETISVFTFDDIESARIQSVGDFAKLTPGLYYSGDWSPSVSTLTIRGVTNNPTADAPVAFVVDGVAYGTSYLMGQDLYDIVQIEVLKGPQGSLYGRNSIGGAINIVTRRPTNDWSGYITGTVGNGGLFKVRTGIYGPIISDKLLFGISATGQQFDGLIENDFLHKKVDFKDGGSARVRFLFTPNEQLTADLTYTYIKYREGSTYWRGDNVPDPLLSPAGYHLPTGIIQSDYLTRADLRTDDYAGKVEYKTSHGTLTAIADYQKVTVPRTVEIDFIQLSTTEVLTSPDTAEVSTFEMRYTSPDDQRLRWSLGGFYQDQERIRAQNVYVNTNPNKDPALKQIVLALVIPTDAPNTLRSVFGQADLDVTPKFTASLGLRYDKDHRRDRRAGLSAEFTSTTPKISLLYKPNPAHSVYALYSEGYRSGGFNPTAVFGREYKPEGLKNYEIGFKSGLLEGRLNLSGAVYYQDYTDQQFYVFSSAAASQALINANKSRAQGVEFEAHWMPLAGLELMAGFNVVDTKIEDFGTFRAFAGITEDDINGNKLLYTPDRTINLAAQYAWSVGNLQASVGMDFVARGRIYWGFDNVENQDPTNVTGARASLGNDQWTVTAYGTNIFDSSYDTFCFVGRFIGNANRINPCAAAEPRQFGAEVTFRF